MEPAEHAEVPSLPAPEPGSSLGEGSRLHLGNFAYLDGFGKTADSTGSVGEPRLMPKSHIAGLSPVTLPKQSVDISSSPTPVAAILLPSSSTLALFDIHKVALWGAEMSQQPTNLHTPVSRDLKRLKHFKFVIDGAELSPAGRYLAVYGTQLGVKSRHVTRVLEADEQLKSVYEVRHTSRRKLFFVGDDRFILCQDEGRTVSLFDVQKRRHGHALLGAPWPLVAASASANEAHMALSFEEPWARQGGEAHIRSYRKKASTEALFLESTIFKGAKCASFSSQDQSLTWASAGSWAAVRDYAGPSFKDVPLLERWVVCSERHGLLVTANDGGAHRLRKARDILKHGPACAAMLSGSWPADTQWRFATDGLRLFASDSTGETTMFDLQNFMKASDISLETPLPFQKIENPRQWFDLPPAVAGLLDMSSVANVSV